MHFSYSTSNIDLQEWPAWKNDCQVAMVFRPEMTGPMSFEPDRNSVVCVSICDFEPSQNGACNWKSLGTTELTCGQITIDV